MQHEIVVGNIGTVYRGTDAMEAHRTYVEYRNQVDAGNTRADATVTWLRAGEVYFEYDAGEV